MTRPGAWLAWTVLALAPVASASERDLAFTWTTRTAEPGRNGFEAWITPRLSRVEDTFALTETRLAWTVGVLPWLETQTSLELDFLSASVRAQTTSLDVRGSTLWHLAPLPASGVLGVGGVARVAAGPATLELEARLILDKALGALLVAVNAAVSRTVYWGGGTGVDTRVEELLALRYAVGTAASVGLELRARSGFLAGAYQGTGFYVGPSVTFRVGPLWFALGLTAQVAADKAPEDRGNGEPLEIRDNDRFVLRLVIGARP